MRCILLVLDSAGIGELPDAAKYGDAGSNTLVNTAKAVGGFNLPVLQRLGLGNIAEIKGVETAANPAAAFGKCAQISAGKDTMTGHWEMMGVKLEKAFPTYPKGFPDNMISQFEQAINRKVIGNKAASGTEIIKELGQRHLSTGYPIVYTSADSVFQIAAHKEKISLDELYKMCQKAEKLFVYKNKIARIIARPFVGKAGAFQRTPERKDFTINPPVNVLDNLIESGLAVIGIGKIDQIFAGRGISEQMHGADNDEHMKMTIRMLGRLNKGLIFTNLGDFDTLWGHRNNPIGYASELEKLDSQIDDLINGLREDDLLIVTADHGCDPTTPSTDHSREYIPILVTGKRVKSGFNLGIRSTFGDIGKTITDFFGVKNEGVGISFLSDLFS